MLVFARLEIKSSSSFKSSVLNNINPSYFKETSVFLFQKEIDNSFGNFSPETVNCVPAFFLVFHHFLCE